MGPQVYHEEPTNIDERNKESRNTGKSGSFFLLSCHSYPACHRDLEKSGCRAAEPTLPEAPGFRRQRPQMQSVMMTVMLFDFPPLLPARGPRHDHSPNCTRNWCCTAHFFTRIRRRPKLQSRRYPHDQPAGRSLPRLETHSGEDVAIYARGPFAHLIGGTLEQHVIFHVMHYAMTAK